jgi:preprotein translocase subunit SecG
VTILLYTVVTLLVAVSFFLILLVLIQKGRGGGLASAFGGVGGHTAFGSKTGDVLTWATSILFGVFLILSVVAGLTFEKVNASVRRPGAMAAPTTPAAPPPRTQDEGPKQVPNQVPPAAPDPGAAGTPTPTTR